MVTARVAIWRPLRLIIKHVERIRCCLCAVPTEGAGSDFLRSLFGWLWAEELTKSWGLIKVTDGFCGSFNPLSPSE